MRYVVFPMEEHAMISIEELEKENQEIIHLGSILSTLVDKPELRSNPVFCELLHRFMEKINAHLTHEARSVYSDLLSHKDLQINNAASQFISNAHELEKILNGYTRRWCVPIPAVEKHSEFIQETNTIFRLLNERITMESDHLFPIIRNSQAH
jgi:hemerythrin-like domain-containing protein